LPLTESEAESAPDTETRRAKPAPRVEPSGEPQRAAERHSGPERPAGVVLPQHAHAAPAAPDAGPRPARPAVTAAPANIEPPTRPDPPRAEVRGVSVVVPAEPGRDGSPAPRIELRLAERAGEIHVAVRTPDPQARQVLRSELPALVERLEQSGYRAEVFSPAAERTASGEPQVARTDATAGDPMNRDFDDGRRRQEHEARPQPAPRPKSQTRSLFHEFFR
jgi:hypothetical protein